MYDYEIDYLLKENHYNISYNDFLLITRNSPQIDHIKYNPYEDNISMWSSDGNNFTFKVFKN